MIHNPYKYFTDNFPKATTVVPQNIINVIKELGENSVVFFLFLLTRNTKWKVFRNLNEIGCDLILNQGETIVKVEVKTRQSVHSTNKKKYDDAVQFAVTALEHKSCDIIIGLWFNRNAYFILTPNQLVPSTPAKKHYRIVITEKKVGDEYIYLYGTKNERKKLIPNNWITLQAYLKTIDKKGRKMKKISF